MGNEQYEDATDGMVSVRMGEEVIIDPNEAAMVTDQVEPNEFVHYDVNLQLFWEKDQTRSFLAKLY